MRSNGLMASVRDALVMSRQSRFECSCREMLILRICGSTCNFYLFSVYCSASGDDIIFDMHANIKATE